MAREELERARAQLDQAEREAPAERASVEAARTGEGAAEQEERAVALGQASAPPAQACADSGEDDIEIVSADELEEVIEPPPGAWPFAALRKRWSSMSRTPSRRAALAACIATAAVLVAVWALRGRLATARGTTVPAASASAEAGGSSGRAAEPRAISVASPAGAIVADSPARPAPAKRGVRSAPVRAPAVASGSTTAGKRVNRSHQPAATSSTRPVKTSDDLFDELFDR